MASATELRRLKRDLLVQLVVSRRKKFTTTAVVVVAAAAMAALQTTHRAAVAVGGYERPDPPLIYTLDLGGLEDSVRALWRGLEKDTETDEFLETCQANTIKDSFASLLRNFMSRTDANGLAGRGKMFVISKAQLAFLCPQVFAADRNGPRRLLDIGSGDGSITERYAGDFDDVVTTETSSVMAGKLRSRGWACYEPGKQDLPLPASDTEKFDFITCLNVLDRADKPLTLLRELKAQLKPGTGRLLLAVVLVSFQFSVRSVQSPRVD